MPIQQGNTTPINSGVAWDLPSNVGAGNSVALAVVCGSTVASVSGLGGVWVGIPGVVGTFDMEWWYCIGATGGSRAITVITSGGGQYWAYAAEYSGVASARTGGTNSGTSIAPSLTVSGIPGELVFVLAESAGIFSGGPTSPWIDYNTGQFALANGYDIAYQVTALSTVTATWAQANASWWTAGLIFSATVPLFPSSIASSNASAMVVPSGIQPSSSASSAATAGLLG